MTLFTVVDIETTGTDPDNDAIVEIASVDVFDGGKIGSCISSLIKPPISIPPAASAIHHIIDTDVEQSPPLREVLDTVLLRKLQTIYVAHNANFERSFLSPYLGNEMPWLCTYKAALRVWPDAPGHSVQVLRYFRNLNVDRTFADQAHRAGPDAYVTARLLRDLMQSASIDDMLCWTTEPALLPTCPIGDDWRGKKWAEVDEGFLKWMLGKSETMDADLVWNARHELQRREDAKFPNRTAYVALACRAASMALSEVDLEQWWRDEEPNRILHGVDSGADAYAELIMVCKRRREVLRHNTEAAIRRKQKEARAA